MRASVSRVTGPTFAGLLAAVGAFAGFGSANAQSAGTPWRGQITLYGWGAGISGDFTPFSGAPTLSVDKSLSEVLHDLDAAFFATGLARKDRFVLFGDLSHSSSSKSGLVSPGVTANGKLTQTSITLAAGRRVVDEADRTVDLMAGIRTWRIDGSVDVPLAGVSVAPESRFTDPIVAVRGNLKIAPRWSILGYADFGGFGVGSKSTYQIAATANYQVNDALYLSAGYRQLYLDYEDHGTRFKGSMTGPILGVTWRF